MKGRPAMERVVIIAIEKVEEQLEKWGITKGRPRRRQDTEQGGRKRVD